MLAEKIGKYELVERLASGSMGTVYSAHAAGVDHVDVGVLAKGHAAPSPVLVEEGANGFGVVLVETTAEGTEGDVFQVTSGNGATAVSSGQIL